MNKQMIMAGLVAVAAIGFAQEQGERVNVPLSDPAKPAYLRANLLSGSITVRGYEGKEVTVETRAKAGERRRERKVPERAAGLRRIDIGGPGFSVEESENNVRISSNANHGNDLDLLIQVPVNTSMKLTVVNGGDIVVERVSGEIEVNNVNGGVKIRNVSGSVIAHALNEDVLVTLDRITEGKSMSFSSMNGDIDVTLPATTKANVKLKADNGEVFSDFEIKLDPTRRVQPQANTRGKDGKYKVAFDRASYGAINGGGPEIQFTTFNGRIYIRKGAN